MLPSQGGRFAPPPGRKNFRTALNWNTRGSATAKGDDGLRSCNGKVSDTMLFYSDGKSQDSVRRSSRTTVVPT